MGMVTAKMASATLTGGYFTTILRLAAPDPTAGMAWKMHHLGSGRLSVNSCIIHAMFELNIPGRGLIQLQHLVCDVNGTLAVDGKLLDGLVHPLASIQDRLTLHLLTADIYGKQEFIDHQLAIQAVRVQPGDEAAQKADYVCRLGAEKVAAIGQGANDASMLSQAALGICVLSPEGVAFEALSAADLVVPSIYDAFVLFNKPLRIVATLRK